LKNDWKEVQIVENNAKSRSKMDLEWLDLERYHVTHVLNKNIYYN